MTDQHVEGVYAAVGDTVRGRFAKDHPRLFNLCRSIQVADKPTDLDFGSLYLAHDLGRSPQRARGATPCWLQKCRRSMKVRFLNGLSTPQQHASITAFPGVFSLPEFRKHVQTDVKTTDETTRRRLIECLLVEHGMLRALRLGEQRVSKTSSAMPGRGRSSRSDRAFPSIGTVQLP